MINSSKIKEKTLHEIWQNQTLSGELLTQSGDYIRILNEGEYNEDSAGPDFKHARIKIGNLTFVGDIEIDLDYSDWKNHGHNINTHYNKVILHLCYSNKQKHNYVYTAEGRKVNSIELKNLISVDYLPSDLQLAGKKIGQSKKDLKCASEIDFVNIEMKKKFLLHLGVVRFQNKYNRIFRRVKELKFLSDLQIKEPILRYELTKEFDKREFVQKDFHQKEIWNQILYEFVFESLGYSKNKNIMMKLAQNCNLKYYNNFLQNDEFGSIIESSLFNISGLIPDVHAEENTSDYLDKLNEIWQDIGVKYDGKQFDETQWHFLGQRPQNFPTVRIYGGSRIVESILKKNLVGVLIKKFTEIQSHKVLINSIRSLFIVKASSYWRDHFVFEKPSKIKLNYCIGLNRADEIFINILLPFLAVYFNVFNNEQLSKKVLRVYNEYILKSDNKIVKNVSADLKMTDYKKKAIYNQAMIELYRNYCTKNRCLNCEIGKRIFN